MSYLLLSLTALLVVKSQDPAPVDVGRSTSKPATEQRGGQMLRMYDVTDLARTLSIDFPAPELGRIRAPQSNDAAEPAPQAPTTDALATQHGSKALEEIVKTYLGPQLDDDPQSSIKATKAGTLVANLRPAQQKWIEEFLESLRAFDGTIEIQARFYSAPSGVLSEWKLAPSATFATPAERAELEERVRADDRFTQLTAPTLQVLPCQRANISITNEVSFVQDWTVEIVEPGHQEIADPQIAVVDEGVALEARATPLADGALGIELRVQQSEVERPIRTEKVRIGTATPHEVELALPSVRTQRFSSTLVLADGAGAIFVGAGVHDGTELAVLVTARRIPAKR